MKESVGRRGSHVEFEGSEDVVLHSNDVFSGVSVVRNVDEVMERRWVYVFVL